MMHRPRGFRTLLSKHLFSTRRFEVIEMNEDFFFSVWFSFDDYISVDKVGARWVSIESVRKADTRRMNNTSMR